MRILKITGMTAIALLILSYFLFQPVFTQFMGWKTWPALPQPPTDVVRTLRTEGTWPQVDKLINELYREGNYPSLSIAIWRDDNVLWAKSIGYADLESRTAATIDTQYRIGSSSKAVNGTLAAVLVDKKLLNLDTPISEYINYFPEKIGPITTRQLLSHMAGIRHYGTCLCFPIWDYENTKHFETVQSAVETFADSPLLFKPGTDFSYSTYGTVLSSAVLEAAGNAPYLDLVERYIATPLELAGLQPDDLTLTEDRRATFYDVYETYYKPSEFIDSSIKWAGGGFVASPKDLARLGGGWLQGDFLAELTRNEFWTPQMDANDQINPQYYALGWRSQKSSRLFIDGKPVHVVHHNGTARGASSNFMLFPEQGIAVSIMTNRSTLQGEDGFHTIALQIGAILIGAEAPDASI